MLQAEKDFVEQYSRLYLVEWCTQTLVHGHITDIRAGNHVTGSAGASGFAKMCLDHAIDKGWVGKTEPRKVLAKGFSTSAAFLKR
jgi:hypothetical protein